MVEAYLARKCLWGVRKYACSNPEFVKCFLTYQPRLPSNCLRHASLSNSPMCTCLTDPAPHCNDIHPILSLIICYSLKNVSLHSKVLGEPHLMDPISSTNWGSVEKHGTEEVQLQFPSIQSNHVIVDNCFFLSSLDRCNIQSRNRIIKQWGPSSSMPGNKLGIQLWM